MLGAIAAALGLTACMASPEVEEKPALSELPSVEKPVWVVGATVYQVDNRDGRERSWSVLDVTDGVVSGENSEGCKWTNSTDWFAPVLSWESCTPNPDWLRGVNTITEQDGQMWPLAVGNHATYKYNSRSLITGEGNTTVQTCEIPETVRIVAAVGEVDAYKIVCTDDDEWSRRVVTWYWTSEMGEVKYSRWHSRRGVQADHDMIRVETPGTS